MLLTTYWTKYKIWGFFQKEAFSKFDNQKNLEDI